MGLVWLLIHRLRRHTPVVVTAKGGDPSRGAGQGTSTASRRSMPDPGRLLGLVVVRGELLQTLLVLAASVVGVVGFGLAVQYATGIIAHLFFAPILIGIVSILVLPQWWVLSMRVGFWASLGTVVVGFCVLGFVEEWGNTQSMASALSMAAMSGVMVGGFLGAFLWALVATGVRAGCWIDGRLASGRQTLVGTDVASILNGRIERALGRH